MDLEIINISSDEEVSIQSHIKNWDNKNILEKDIELISNLAFEYDEIQKDEDGQILVNIGHSVKDENIYFDTNLAEILKPHQISGIRFLYSNIIGSIFNFNINGGKGCLLAHCMGLGKTLQAIAFSDIYLNYTPGRCILCLVPTSTIPNWLKEFDKWLASKSVNKFKKIQATSIKGNKKININYLVDSEHKGLHSKLDILNKWKSNGGVLIMGYELFRSLSQNKKHLSKFDIKNLANGYENKSEFYKHLVNPGPDLLICDEGHRIKSQYANLSKILTKIRTLQRIILTGYPLQNNLIEYWCMIEFVRPGFLGPLSSFKETFEKPITKGQDPNATPWESRIARIKTHVLHKLLSSPHPSIARSKNYSISSSMSLPHHPSQSYLQNSHGTSHNSAQFVVGNHANQGVMGGSLEPPVVQRRDETLLNRQLPPKHEYVLFIKMSPLQRLMYKRLKYKYLSNLNRQMGVPLAPADNNVSKGHLAFFSMALKIWNHPQIIKSKSSSRITTPDDYTQGIDDLLIDKDQDLRLEKSGKMEIFLRILEECIARKEKLLLFSQSVLTLDYVESFLSKVELWPNLHHENPLSTGNGIREKRPGKGVKMELGVNYLRLDGSTPLANREVSIRLFNSDNGDPSLTCPSTKSKRFLSSSSNHNKASPIRATRRLRGSKRKGDDLEDSFVVNDDSEIESLDDGNITSVSEEIMTESDTEASAGPQLGKRSDDLFSPELSDTSPFKGKPKSKLNGIFSEDTNSGIECLELTDKELTLIAEEKDQKILNENKQPIPAPDDIGIKNASVDNPFHLFLLSTRAGSLGINLTPATRVIIMDVGWNPCWDAQALARVYRMGQTRPTTVYRLVCAKPAMESKVFARQLVKTDLSNLVVDKSGTLRRKRRKHSTSWNHPSNSHKNMADTSDTDSSQLSDSGSFGKPLNFNGATFSLNHQSQRNLYETFNSIGSKNSVNTINDLQCNHSNNPSVNTGNDDNDYKGINQYLRDVHYNASQKQSYLNNVQKILSRNLLNQNRRLTSLLPQRNKHNPPIGPSCPIDVIDLSESEGERKRETMTSPNHAIPNENVVNWEMEDEKATVMNGDFKTEEIDLESSVPISNGDILDGRIEYEEGKEEINAVNQEMVEGETNSEKVKEINLRSSILTVEDRDTELDEGKVSELLDRIATNGNILDGNSKPEKDKNEINVSPILVVANGDTSDDKREVKEEENTEAILASPIDLVTNQDVTEEGEERVIDDDVNVLRGIDEGGDCKEVYPVEFQDEDYDIIISSEDSDGVEICEFTGNLPTLSDTTKSNQDGEQAKTNYESSDPWWTNMLMCRNIKNEGNPVAPQGNPGFSDDPKIFPEKASSPPVIIDDILQNLFTNSSDVGPVWLSGPPLYNPTANSSYNLIPKNLNKNSFKQVTASPIKILEETLNPDEITVANKLLEAFYRSRGTYSK